MSNITEVIIYAGRVSDKVAELLTYYLPDDEERNQKLEKVDMSYVGGTKFFTSNVYAAALNYYSINNLVAWFDGLPWEKGDCAIMICVTEYGDKPEIVVRYNE